MLHTNENRLDEAMNSMLLDHDGALVVFVVISIVGLLLISTGV